MQGEIKKGQNKKIILALIKCANKKARRVNVFSKLNYSIEPLFLP
jgi:hypothetical protein